MCSLFVIGPLTDKITYPHSTWISKYNYSIPSILRISIVSPMIFIAHSFYYPAKRVLPFRSNYNTMEFIFVKQLSTPLYAHFPFNVAEIQRTIIVTLTCLNSQFTCSVCFPFYSPGEKPNSVFISFHMQMNVAEENHTSLLPGLAFKFWTIIFKWAL